MEEYYMKLRENSKEKYTKFRGNIRDMLVPIKSMLNDGVESLSIKFTKVKKEE